VAWAIVLAILAFFTLLPVAAMALAWWRFAWRLRHPYPAPQRLPEVAVVLPLRGADPSLEACLAGVLAQDYPAYQVHIVVDSAEDPAHAVVANVLARGHALNATVHVDIRRDWSERCSLKLSAQRQVLTRLDEAVALVMFLDADSVPSAGWLRADGCAVRGPARRRCDRYPLGRTGGCQIGGPCTPRLQRAQLPAALSLSHPVGWR
jgi:cellulose synthase/poly-beta-1,6-N-acetylglucosamine synthase-like glycosyltransferase